jgi:hypothetical protein
MDRKDFYDLKREDCRSLLDDAKINYYNGSNTGNKFVPRNLHIPIGNDKKNDSCSKIVQLGYEFQRSN